MKGSALGWSGTAWRFLVWLAVMSLFTVATIRFYRFMQPRFDGGNEYYRIGFRAVLGAEIVVFVLGHFWYWQDRHQQRKMRRISLGLHPAEVTGRIPVVVVQTSVTTTPAPIDDGHSITS